ncbi:MAG: penicillin-binding protein 2 [Bacteroidetes bacterium]|nr:MAG: penicillin-binding protein 2 [Bacteroidota bacterium]
MRKDQFSIRRYFIIGTFILVGLILWVKLMILQVFDDTYKVYAERISTREVTQYPARGLIYDRNGKLLVVNEAVYDLIIIPREAKNIDTAAFCALLNITKEQYLKYYQRAKEFSTYKPSVFMGQISKMDYAYLEEKLFKFPGFFVQPRTVRKYPYAAAAQTLGYVGEVSPHHIEKDQWYKSGDYIGISGLENTYEEELRGEKGKKIILVDVHNRAKGAYRDGAYDTVATKGNNLTTTLDIDLQVYGEFLMQHKKGSAVAIEPQTGEILCAVSTPTYDPNLLVGRIRNQNYKVLSNDEHKPLYNRTSMATYPPGSTFKLLNAAIAIEEGVLTPYSRYSCNGPESKPIRCTHHHETPLGCVNAIKESCNPFFWNTFKGIINKYEEPQIGFNKWKEYVISFGLGHKFQTDLFSERAGNVPNDAYYNRYYGEGHWNALTVRSLAIGQGELLLTPLQMANLTATIANRGYYIKPHFIKQIQQQDGITSPTLPSHERVETGISRKSFKMVIDGMEQVVENGTGRYYARVDSISICGKTGTVQNPHGEDHSIFIAFAPKENPKIAIAVVVENSGFGSTWAAPIASLMIEKYLTGGTTRTALEEKMSNAIFIQTQPTEESP